MPIFEYRCKSCERIDEVLQRSSDPTPEICPFCNRSHTLEKIVSQTSFQLKGNGWYKDLYGSSKKTETTSNAAPTKPASDAGASQSKTASDTKATP